MTTTQRWQWLDHAFGAGSIALRRDSDLQAMAELSSRTTHAAQECLEACRLLAVALERALAGAPATECWISAMFRQERAAAADRGGRLPRCRA